MLRDTSTAAEVLQSAAAITQSFQGYKIFSQCKTIITKKTEKVLVSGSCEPIAIPVTQNEHNVNELVDIYIDIKEKERQMGGKFEFQHRDHNGTRDVGFVRDLLASMAEHHI